MTADTIDIRVPGAVYYDALDPLATEVPGELELPTPTRKKVGKGDSFFYSGLTIWQAEEVVTHLRDRADTLWGSTDPAERSTLRACSDTAEKIRKALAARS